jgi:hypothetical protein
LADQASLEASPHYCALRLLTQWHKEAIDTVGDMGWLNALAVDAAGRIHVAYSDETNQALKYARRVPGIKLLPAIILASVGLFLIAGGLVGRYFLRHARKG